MRRPPTFAPADLEKFGATERKLRETLGLVDVDPNADARGRFRPYTLALHHEYVTVLQSGKRHFDALGIATDEMVADEAHLEGLDRAEEAIRVLLRDLRAGREAVKVRMVDRTDKITAAWQADLLDPRTPPEEAREIEALVQHARSIIDDTNVAVFSRGRSTAQLKDRVASLEADVSRLSTENQVLRGEAGPAGPAAPPPAARRRTRR